MVKAPEQPLLAAYEVDTLVVLVATGDAERRRVILSVLLAQHERTVGGAVDPGHARNAGGLVVYRRPLRMIDDEHAQPELVRKLLFVKPQEMITSL